jgi:hypothetical protein
MPFPFLPGGVLLAAAVLSGSLIIFGLALRAMDRAILASRGSMLHGLVAGFRTWAEASPSESRASLPAEPASPTTTETFGSLDSWIVEDHPAR